VKVITRAIVDGQFVGHSASQQDTSAHGDYESLAHEIQILSRLNHPNVVRCLGGCLRPPRVFVVQGEGS
jgi:serine/threonine protein kinase